MAWDDLKKIARRRRKRDLPEGLWILCKGCKNTVYRATVEENSHICPECGYHFQIEARRRVEIHFDKGTFEEIDPDMESVDILEFDGVEPYHDKIRKAQAKSHLKDAILAGRARLKGVKVYVAITEFGFMSGSMGSVLGEKITRTLEHAHRERVPVIVITGSGGGARMQEGAVSLMQMAKTSAAIARFQESGMPYITVLTNPTMAGVLASFASLGDVVIAEPGALIGFTGPRVIKQTINVELPKGFQSSEFLLDHGLIDMIARRDELRDVLADLIFYMGDS